jgi:hypothetical protein
MIEYTNEIRYLRQERKERSHHYSCFNTELYEGRGNYKEGNP